MKKNKIIQLNLFESIPLEMEDKVYIDFCVYADKLEAEGLFQISPEWWLSRFHDMLYPGHNMAKTDGEWTYRYNAEKNWPVIWNRFETEWLAPRWDKLCLDAWDSAQEKTV